jgi:hypothetical protein
LLVLSKSNKRARTATRGGSAFVLPDEAFGEHSAEHIVFRPERPMAHAYRLKGSFDVWRGKVAARAVGNSRLALIPDLPSHHQGQGA